MSKEKQNKLITQIMDANVKDGLYEGVTNGHDLDKTFKQKSKWSKVKKQTAVEWLFEQFFKVKWGSMPGNMPTIFEQAKAMEKEQIEKAFVEGGVQYMANIGDDIPPKAKNYYDKTYTK